MNTAMKVLAVGESDFKKIITGQKGVRQEEPHNIRNRMR
jgi:hypothetical protein